MLSATLIRTSSLASSNNDFRRDEGRHSKSTQCLCNCHDSNRSLSNSYHKATTATTAPVVGGEADLDTRLNQLNHQIEELSTQNSRLIKTNRLLKSDLDKTNESLKLSIEQNIRLQRANRLLQEDIKHKSHEVNQLKEEHTFKMNQIGPEYEYLVQVVNALYKQLFSSSSSTAMQCNTTCCFTGNTPKQINYPSADSTTTNETSTIIRHLCRPVIQSNTIEYHNKLSTTKIVALEKENNELQDALSKKEKANETLQFELKVKDNIIKQLENDFKGMELELTVLQKDWCLSDPSSYNNSSLSSELHSFPPVPL